jgi:transcriptional regulator with XRE-family HTH domain
MTVEEEGKREKLDPEVSRHFGTNLARKREFRGFSQEQLGMTAGLHRTHIGLLERGLRTPRLDTIAKLASALKIDPGELFDGIEWRPAPTTVGSFELSDADEARERRLNKQRELMERAGVLRTGQPGQSDVAALARAAREELEQRG